MSALGLRHKEKKMADNTEIYKYISSIVKIKKFTTVRDMLMRRFKLTEAQAQEYIWSWKIEN